MESRTACFGPPHVIKKYNEFGLYLNFDFGYAKRGDVVQGPHTKSLINFLVKAGDKSYIVDCSGLPLIAGEDVYNSTGFIVSGSSNKGIITSGDMSIIINDYLLHKNNASKEKRFNADKFYEQYFLFINNCRRVARNVIRYPKVRVSFEKTLKEQSATYKDFIDFLENEADDMDFEMKQSLKHL